MRAALTKYRIPIILYKAPAALGPYSAGVEVTGSSKTVYVSGQIPVDPATGNFAGDDIQMQTAQSLTNIRNILSAAGMDMSDVVKTTVYLADIVYATFFTAPFPARCAVQVAALPKGAKLEIDAVACR